MDTHKTVFGPERPNAAVRAIAELQRAQDAVNAGCGWASDDAYQRLAIARYNRAQYGEYADSFRGH